MVPGSAIDFLSDYDIELYVSNLAFAANDDWLTFMGPIMVRWPYQPRATVREGWITRLVLFQDGVRVDFQITADLHVSADAYRNGGRVLVDKDNLFAHLREPSYTEYLVKKPTAERYEELVHEFWWDAIYLPKYLWRKELPFAKYMLDHVLRHNFLYPMIEWYLGTITDWTANPGLWGKRFKHYLDQETWWQLEATFAGADLGEVGRHFCPARSVLLISQEGRPRRFHLPCQTRRRCESTVYGFPVNRFGCCGHFGCSFPCSGYHQ